MTNSLRAPWEIMQNSSYPSLYDVYDCDGNPIVKAKILEVAQLIAAAPKLQETAEQFARILSRALGIRGKA
jgi:hypothetical protein